MFKIIKRYSQSGFKARALVYADTTGDLTTKFDGVTLTMGTKAYIINSGEWYMLNGSGEWKEMQAAAAEADSANESDEA